jgi:hypothetical protein
VIPFLVSKAGDFEAAARRVEAQWRLIVDIIVPRRDRTVGSDPYDIAHDSMEFLWFVKRLMPETIYRVFAWMYANRKWRFKDA